MPRSLALKALYILAAVAAAAGACGKKEAGIEGTWQGVLEYPGISARLVFVISSDSGGRLSAVMMSPDESGREQHADTLSFVDGRVEIELRKMGCVFEGRYLPEADRIEGEWKRGPRAVPVSLGRIDRVEVISRPQTPKPPFPYSEVEVVFRGGGPDVSLAGTLTIPPGAGPFPAAIIISGGGGQDRDGTFFRHVPFMVLADYLSRRAIAVLRYDDRGVGSSTGDRAKATSEDYARDAMGAFEYLRGRDEIDPGSIGFIGHSEGGTIAAIAASRTSGAAFIVMLCSPGLPGREYNLQYEESVGRSMGLSDEAIASRRKFQEKVLDIVIGEKDPEKARESLEKLYAAAEPPIPAPQIKLGLQRVLSPWFRFSVSHDPARTLEGLACPVLAIFGGKDVQVPPEGNLDAVRAALASSGALGGSAEVLDGLNHFLQTAPTGNPKEYAKIDETISPPALDRIYEWLQERLVGGR